MVHKRTIAPNLSKNNAWSTQFNKWEHAKYTSPFKLYDHIYMYSIVISLEPIMLAVGNISTTKQPLAGEKGVYDPNKQIT